MKNSVGLIVGNVRLDEINYALTNGLNTEDLVRFVISLGDDLTENYEFYCLLKRKVDKIVQEYQK